MTNSADPDQKPTDLDLHCLQRQGFSRTRVNKKKSLYTHTHIIQNSLYHI